ncbi:hypothetical protein EV126DRAFT_410812 [Verticillium dahliae]|nr:hypothetical protein EV126DRAFT_410812 [Verticillium dahliae]
MTWTAQLGCCCWLDFIALQVSGDANFTVRQDETEGMPTEGGWLDGLLKGQPLLRGETMGGLQVEKIEYKIIEKGLLGSEGG